MRVNDRRKAKNVALGPWLVALGVAGVLLAAAAPFIASRVLIHTSAADDVGFLILMVGLIAIAIDRRR
jgi:hypothetical protein